MKEVLVTGAAGFLGRNLCVALGRHDDVRVTAVDLDTAPERVQAGLARVDVIYHLAGVNRPLNESEFQDGNVGSTKDLVDSLGREGRTPTIVLASSIQADLDNPYGRSKKAAEQVLLDYRERTGASVCIYRLPNVFGKWSRPNYNTVVATFCYNIARDLEISINDPNREIELVYVDDVVERFLTHLGEAEDSSRFRYSVSRTFRVTLGELADRIRAFRSMVNSLVVPDLGDELNRCLHATYLSFVPHEQLAHQVTLRTDVRGWLFELIKSPHFGQIFVSSTRPGVIRGNHYHDSKIERFCVIEGEATIRLRHVQSGELTQFDVSSSAIRIVDIPPGCTHSIENAGTTDMLCLFWANAIFDPDAPDTHARAVQP